MSSGINTQNRSNFPCLLFHSKQTNKQREGNTALTIVTLNIQFNTHTHTHTFLPHTVNLYTISNHVRHLTRSCFVWTYLYARVNRDTNINALYTALYSISFFFLSPTSFYLTMVRCRGLFALGHTRDTPQSVGLLWTRDRPVVETWQHTTLTTDIHVSGGIRTRNPSRRAAAAPRLRPLGHWDRLYSIYVHEIG